MSIQETISRNKLVYQSQNEFQKAGYSLWNENIKSNAFDFIAKKNNLPGIRSNSSRIITKVLVDLDLFKKQTSIDLQLFSKLISGFPLLVAHTAAGKKIEKATLYRRHNVSAISLNTLHMLLQNEKDLHSTRISKFAHRGGIFVNLSKERLQKRRKQLKLDMTILAKKIGISRQSLYKYEKGESSPKLKYFKILSQILGENLDAPIDILGTQFQDISHHSLEEYQNPLSQLQKEITSYLVDKDFNIIWFKSEPFDALSEPKIESNSPPNKIDVSYPMIAGVTSSNYKNDSGRLLLINSLSKFLNKKAIWFMDDTDDPSGLQSKSKASHITIIKISDLEGMDPGDFENILNKNKQPKVIPNQRID